MMPLMATWVLIGVLAAFVCLGVAGSDGQKKKVIAGKHCDAEGHPKVFTLSLAHETITLDPGKVWSKADNFKWVTRGLIEQPQSFHVLADGTVEINGEKIGVNDPDGAAKLEQEMNKRHAGPAAAKAPAASSPRAAVATAPAPRSDRVEFKVRVDHLGHLMVECFRGGDRVETGLRGLPGLIQNGLMLKPKNLRVDPLLRAVEIDGVRFECNETGGHQLEAALNARYAPKLRAEGDSAIEIKENSAASTGFLIRFVTMRAGARFEVKGHLSQEHLDVLQDPNKCELLQPGIVLRLSPPFLLIRRRRHDGSEEKIPELPDVQYRHITALQLQRILNHALIRRATGAAALDTPAETEQPKEIVAMRLERNPQNKALLWLKCVTSKGGAPEAKAFTHHNIADLQHAGLFRSEVDVSLSLDHRTLGILNKPTNQEEKITIDPASSDADLAQASAMLTAALKPPTTKPEGARPETKPGSEPHEAKLPLAIQPEIISVVTTDAGASPEPTPSPVLGGEPPATETSNETPFLGGTAGKSNAQADARGAPENTPPAEKSKSEVAVPEPLEKDKPAPAEPPVDAVVLALFKETDPLRINAEVFRCLAERLSLPVQDVRLSLERVFDNRRFQVLSFTHPEVTSVLELRSEEFHGFYLSHISDRKILLVYAKDGKHIEWGPNQCELQASVATEPDEFRGSALLGLAQSPAGHFVFVVAPEYKNWSKSRAKIYEEASAKFATAKEIAAAPKDYSLVWPEPNRPA